MQKEQSECRKKKVSTKQMNIVAQFTAYQYLLLVYSAVIYSVGVESKR